MPAAAKYQTLWTEDELIPYPREAWLEDGFPAAALPEGDEVPLDVEVVYTAYLTGSPGLYDTISLGTEDGKVDLRLIVVGAVEDDKNLLYVLDPASGDILQLDQTDPRDVQAVNSNYRCFIEFLYHFQQFVNADEGKPGRAERAASLREILIRLDPNAFAAGTWWPLVFDQLTS
ncbi:SUKH-4 family immunity protein [Glycomyces sp. YM15]|uniref:SUKH-4 family immunity protein n=1 Tax=Glycomyces sp. YM15 TaxID=2800446 RepID=UPI0019661DC1|nr:SUKH-4 family immunity protein [Glycomyces sp. YM15]